MTGAAWAINHYKREEEAKIFKGTLLGIAVSFLILIFFAFLLNLAENYWYLNKNLPAQEVNAPNNRSISEGERFNDGYVGAAEDGLSYNFLNKLLGIKTAHAATYARSDYKATLLLRSATNLELSPGEEITYRVGFKNIGKAPWYNNSRNFISIYTYSPKYRKSAMRDSGWYRYNQPAKLRESQVGAGALGFIEFKLKASSKTGNYIETFHLAAEDKAWIEGGEFSIPITVIKKATTDFNQSASNQSSQIPNSQFPISNQTPVSNFQYPISNLNSNYKANLLLTSHDKVNAKTGEVVDLRFGFKNTGTNSWNIRGVIAPSETLLSNGRSIFYNPTWTSGHQPTVIGGSGVKPGHLGFVNFKIKAPDVAGDYTAKFKLVANYDKEVDGGYIEIPVYVTDESSAAEQSGRVVNRLNMQEPEIEIGLYYLTSSAEAVELTADKNYQLKNKSGTVLANLSAYESVRITYDFASKIFYLQNARLNLQISGELDFKGTNKNTVFTMLSMTRTTSAGWNDNKYRDEIILRLADTTSRLWVINKLPMEHYLWGIAETSNISPLDYIKSIIVASRTYAAYHYQKNSKYGGYFHMRATTADQLYRGYNSEVRRSRVVQAVNETKGEVLTYGGDIVVTPYYGHSDGKTRSWKEVWGGSNKPWLVSVPIPSDVGRTLWGHGVGMSALGAYHNANTDGWNYTKILRYYYTGVEVSRVY